MSEEIKIVKIVNCKGETCPSPYIKSKRALSKIAIGEILKVIIDEPCPRVNLAKSLIEDGHIILEKKQVTDTDWEVIVKKGGIK
ncbi:MAG: sulfurtransferase TusA family protein [Armatimonadetes bacterium]|nr:sulfurtransferase TusA family protein [Armatimonadota bacterium]